MGAMSGGGPIAGEAVGHGGGLRRADLVVRGRIPPDPWPEQGDNTEAGQHGAGGELLRAAGREGAASTGRQRKEKGGAAPEVGGVGGDVRHDGEERAAGRRDGRAVARAGRGAAQIDAPWRVAPGLRGPRQRGAGLGRRGAFLLARGAGCGGGGQWGRATSGGGLGRRGKRGGGWRLRQEVGGGLGLG
nr:glycine-rich cell wall structural protein 1-like [Aegilops tauschii subsp. strangulata]